ncbi:4-amino-4-deoxy-L-arabinose lipid A transferase, partial [Enterobacter roggenkampii]|nr:4-amino-4-deoxy-L-arabinose lipid A transferase [Enterobacter roggenkampii]
LMMSLWDALRMNMMISYQELVRTFPDVKDRFVGKGDFAQWLAEHRQQGRVSLVILLSKRDDLSRANLPEPDSLYIQGRLAYLQYLPK